MGDILVKIEVISCVFIVDYCVRTTTLLGTKEGRATGVEEREGVGGVD
jgi:hypothetical protein